MSRSGLVRRVAALRPLGDAAIAILALWLAFRVRIALELPFTEQLLPADRISGFERAWPWLAAAQLFCVALVGLYDDFRPLPRLELARRALLVAGFQAVAGAAAIFLAEAFFSRSVLLLYALLDAPLLYLWRRALAWLPRAEIRRLALVGRGPAAREVARSLAAHRWHGLEVAGHVPVPGEGPDADAEAAPELGPALGTVEDLPGLLLAGSIDDILLAPRADTWQAALVDRLAGVRPPRSSVLLVPGPFESLIGRMRYRWVNDLPVIEVIRESEWRLRPPAKRLLDLVAGGALALLALPVVALCALAVRLTSPGPVLYRQLRVGAGLAPFELWKLRTMRMGAEDGGEERLASVGDERLTPIGGWLRRYRLDELPQLAHVLSGRMSLVGPRPERPGFVQSYLATVPGYRERFSVAPGLTGLAQVNGEYDSSPENKLRYDLAYIATWSPWLDLSILFRTVKIVLTSRGL
jgi:exopolysaccharide biosynthesis polyprenyl glycosylphosphotransferase